MATTELQCPKCNSNQLTANKKGFSGKQAVAGAILTGGIGLLAGTIGSKRVIITCLSCGKEFKPGEGKTVNTFSTEKPKTIVKEVRKVLTTVEDINNEPIVWSTEQQAMRYKKELSPEELEIKEKLKLEREIRHKENRKEARKNAVIYSAIALLIAIVPLVYLFKKAFNSDFGFFFFMLFMFGCIITFFILKLIWDLIKVN